MSRSRRLRQGGAALILFATVLVLGVCWYAVESLATLRQTGVQRATTTSLALQSAKQALLAYAVQYASRSSFNVPGRLPCPESPNAIGTATEGNAASSCSNATAEIGRLPWRTLGIEQPRDGDGEPLWYVLGPGFREAPINFGSLGQLVVDGAPNAAVALIVAPGAALNTVTEPGTPPAGCAAVNQQASRYSAPLAAARFLECGNASGSYVTVGPAPWSNDRVIAITASELLSAIAGAVADRLQREALPALWTWNAVEFAARGKSWAASYNRPFYPYASTFGDPTSNDYCGDAPLTERRGLPPIASTATAACTSAWAVSSTNVDRISGFSCIQTGSEISCSGTRTDSSGPRAWITLRAENVANGFRGTIVAADVTASHSGNPSVDSMSISSATGRATTVIYIGWPSSVPGGATVTVRIPNLADAAVLADARVAWFINNEWYRYAYYEVSRGETVNNSNTCSSSGDTDCIQVQGLPSSTGTYWNKRLVLVLSGPALPGQSRPSANVTDYFEEQNASPGDRVYRADLKIANPAAVAPPHPAFNDRVAACPYQVTTSTGTGSLCN